MQAFQLVLPAIATVALGAALLVPLRDDRRGKRATLGGSGSPLQPSFSAVAAPDDELVPTGCVDDLTPHGACEASAPVDHEDDGSQAKTAAAEPLMPDASRTTLQKFAQVFVHPTCVDQASDTRAAAAHGVGGIVANVLRGAFRSGRGAANESPQLLAAAQPSVRSSDEDVLYERSFASELAELVGPAREDAPPSHDPHVVTPSRGEDGDGATRAIEPDAGTRQDEEMVPLVLRAAHGPVDRVLPLTRLPLRAQVDTISWPSLVATPREVKTRDDRHALLEALERSGDASAETALLEAYHQEDAPGRLLVLRALMHGKFARAGSVFREALRTGTDEERGLAVDALANVGDRDGVIAALCDRIDAIVAKAALAYVGIEAREAYRAALAPHMEAARIEAILDLLAGIIE